jgi:hypothetical protein
LKKTIIITGIVIYTLFAVSLIFAGQPEQQKASVTHQLPTSLYTRPTVTEAKELYVVKDKDGLIAVSEMSTGKIISTTETRVALLPESDRKRLKNGIVVEGKRAFIGLLEDICS